jgi:acyl-CoA thioester hydrolase
MLSTELTLTAQFYDLDPMGIVWHGHYARFFELARCQLLDKIAYGYDEMQVSGYIWPIVDMRIKFVRSIRFHQQFIVAALLAEYANRLKIDYVIRDKESGEVLTKAHTIQVAVDAMTGELCLESPAALRDKVGREL